MINYVTYGRFGNKANLEKEKELFLTHIKNMIDKICLFKNIDINIREIKDEIEISNILKDLIKKRNKSDRYYDDYLGFLMTVLGLPSNGLSQEEKDEIWKMDFTFKSWEKKSNELFNKYFEKAKKICPKEAQFCLEDKVFLMYIHSIGHCEFRLDNFLHFIRDYFILEENRYLFEEYVPQDKFDEIKKKVINIYPKLKEKYSGRNRYLEKFLSFFEIDNDYYYAPVKKILDDYYSGKNNKLNNNEDETIKLKDKID